MSKKPVLAQALASGDVLQAETVRLSVRESSRLAIDFFNFHFLARKPYLLFVKYIIVFGVVDQ